MRSKLDRSLLARLDEFASVEVLRTRHTRQIRRGALIVSGCAVACVLCQILLVTTVVPDPLAGEHPSILPWYETYFWASDPLFGGLIVSGQVHALQAAMVIIACVTLGRLALAHWRQPALLDEAARRRAHMTPERLRELFEDKAAQNAEIIEFHATGSDAMSASLARALKSVMVFGVLLWVLALGSMDNLSQNIWRFSQWERALRKGVFWEFSYVLLGIGALCLCAAPLWALYHWERASARRLLDEARQDMIVLQREVLDRSEGDLEGALSRAEVHAQSGELSLDESRHD